MAQVERITAGVYKVTGILDFSTVTPLLTQIHSLSGVNEDMTVDFSALERSNSAGLALLLELLADAKQQKRKISFSGIPDQLLDLARMSNIDHLLLQ